MLGRSPAGAPRMRRGRHGLRVLAGAALLTLGLGACGQADGGGGVASLSGQGQATTTTTAAGGKDFQEARLKWAQCMRENGVDVPDPGADGRIEIRKESGSGGGERRVLPDEDPDFQKAEKACEKHMQGVQPPAGFKPEEMQERLLNLAKCLRGKGYDVPDPQFSDGGRRSLMRVAPKNVDPESKEFQDAMRECEKQSGLDELRRNAGKAP